MKKLPELTRQERTIVNSALITVVNNWHQGKSEDFVLLLTEMNAAAAGAIRVQRESKDCA